MKLCSVCKCVSYVHFGSHPPGRPGSALRQSRVFFTRLLILSASLPLMFPPQHSVLQSRECWPTLIGGDFELSVREPPGEELMRSTKPAWWLWKRVARISFHWSFIFANVIWYDNETHYHSSFFHPYKVIYSKAPGYCTLKCFPLGEGSGRSGFGITHQTSFKKSLATRALFTPLTFAALSIKLLLHIA